MKHLFVLAHGAGAGSAHPWMQRYQRHLSLLGRVQAFDHAYISEGRRLPDRKNKLILRHQEALRIAVASATNSEPIVLVGKSMGSRMGCHVAAIEAERHAKQDASQYRQIRALVCLGYPLLGMGKTAKLRDQVLLRLRTPTLFVQGTRDKLCPLEQLEVVRQRMQCPTAVHVVQSGDHSLLATKTHLKQQRTTQSEIEGALMKAIETFLAGLV